MIAGKTGGAEGARPLAITHRLALCAENSDCYLVARDGTGKQSA